MTKENTTTTTGASSAPTPQPAKTKKVVQSYNITTLHAKLTTLQVRIMARIVEKCQPTIRAQAKSLREAIEKGQLNSPSDIVGEKQIDFAFTAKELLNTNTHNYSQLRKAINDLQKRVVEYYDFDAKKWYSAALISAAEMETNTGRTILTCPAWLLGYICNFNRGASYYDIVKALQLRRSASARLYMLLGGQSMPITYKVEELRAILGATEKYAQTRDLIKRLIEPARKELEENNYNGFSYTTNKESDAKNAAVKSITFHPIKREAQNEASLLARLTAKNIIPEALHDYMLGQLHFTSKELGANKRTLAAFAKRSTWREDFIRIVDRARKKNKGKGYIINAIKGVVKGD